LMGGAPGDVLVYGLADEAFTDRRQALSARGVQAVVMPPPGLDTPGVDLGEVLADLARRGVNELHVEAGARLNAALIEGGWVDELLVYLAPTLLGPGRPFADLSLLPGLEYAPRFEWRDLALVGGDVRLIARWPG